MPFQQPPTLPDYNKLIAVLNSSGMQKVDPPVYEILSRLIQAVKQSQDVVSQTINNNILVNVLTALAGDGSLVNPLRVLVDGVTVTVNGSNQLVASGGGTGQTVLENRVTINNARIIALNSNPVVMVPAQGVGTIIQVLWCNSQYHPDPGSPNFYNNGSAGDLYYSNGGAFTAGKNSWHLATVVPGASFDGVFSLGQQNSAPFIIQPTQIGPEDTDVILVGADNSLAFGGSGAIVNFSCGYTIIDSL